MSERGAGIPDTVLGALQASGFPLQTAVAQVINTSPGWSVYASEYPWLGPGYEDKFLDVIARNAGLFLAIECKKTRKEQLIFLRPLGLFPTGQVEDFRCLQADRMRDSTQRVEIYCDDWALKPKSTCSAFCIVSTRHLLRVKL
jgi:hypothetical protein